MADCLLRSLMFIPAHNKRLLDSSLRTDADALLLDLEDSVQPAANKTVARNQILDYLEQGKFNKRQIFPRVNDRESGELLRDVTTLDLPGIDEIGRASCR